MTTINLNLCVRSTCI